MINEPVQAAYDHQYRDSFYLLFNQIEDCLFIFDQTGRIIQANKAALEKLEYSLEEIQRLNFEQLHPLMRLEEVQSTLQGMIGGVISEVSTTLCTKSERQLTVETRLFKGKWQGIDVFYAICKSVPGYSESLFDQELMRYAATRKNETLNCEVRTTNENVYDRLFQAEITPIANQNYLLTIIRDITEVRKQIEQEQKLNNIQLIIDSMPFLAWVKDKSSKFIAVNKAGEDFCRKMNREIDSIVGKTDFEIFPIEMAMRHIKIEEEIIKSKTKQKLNRIRIKTDKIDEWFEILVLPIFEDNGEVSGTMGVANKITEQVQLEIELANQKRFLKTIIDTIPDFIFYKDKNSAYIGCNKANAEKVLGVKEDEVIGKTSFDLNKESDLPNCCLQNDKEVLIGGKMLKFEEQITLTDGTLIDAETVKTPFLDEQGNVAGLIGIARDITERKRLEKGLREQAEYAELLFRTVPSAVLSVDKDRKITRWNKIAEQITGYAAAEVIGKECSLVLHGICSEECNLCRNACEAPLISQMCTIVTKEGHEKHVLKSIGIVKNEYGEIKEKIECFEDITVITNMGAELKESNERYAAIVNNAPQIVVIHKQGIIKFVNIEGRKVTGYKEDECIGHHIKDFIPNNSFKIVNTSLQERAEGKPCVPYEIELIKKSGEIINILVKGSDITFEREEATLAVMIDITDSKRLNAKLKMSEERFRLLAETINEIFLITDMERIVYVSPAYEKISGMSSQSLLNNPYSLAELIHPVDRERMWASFFQNFRNMNEAVNEEFRIIRLDGEIRWLWLQSYPMLDKANNSMLKATSVVDITDRKKIEVKLFEREQQTKMEILLAERVQRNSLPHPFNGQFVRVSTIFEPCSTVSGDFFNYKWFEKQKKLCGYIMDVSGHGMATALQTATFKMELDNVLLKGNKIDEDSIQAINRKIMSYLYEDSFVALLYFEFDLQAGILKLISAGITLFLAVRSQECSMESITGCYLGIVNHPEIETKAIPLNAGELYFLMSDGASDLIEMHGVSREESSSEYMKWLEDLAKSPDRNDDFSVLCIEVLKVNKEICIVDINNALDLQHAQTIIGEYLQRNAPDLATTLEVAINEALNNGFNAGKRVCVKLRQIGGILIIRVKDDGPGFNTYEANLQSHREIMEERFDDVLEEESGRGILLMRMFCDKVLYNAKGNEVLLTKKL